MDVILSKQNYLACETVNRFAKVTGTINSYTACMSEGASAGAPAPASYTGAVVP